MKTVANIDRIYANAVDVIPREELERRLQSGATLRVKLGIDPTAPDIHLGFVVVLKKLREFQELGHTAVLVIGDYTARVGDPSGRSKTRPILSPEQIEENTKTYLEQAYLVLDRDRTEVRHNSEWLAPLTMADIIELTRATTVARILERDDFSKRYAAGDPITLTEILYPLMQAYDSVAVDADVELGGTDQLYNLLAGREVMTAYGKEPQVVLTTPLLLSWDGTKMSSSVGNNIPLTMAPEEQFGRTMRISDDQLPQWYRLVLEQPVPDGDPLEAKLELARAIVRRSHGEEAARTAEAHFTRVVREGSAPEDVPEAPLPEGDPLHLPKLLADHGLAPSTSEARRLIAQHAVRLDGEVVHDLDVPRGRLEGALLQAGRRRFLRFA